MEIGERRALECQQVRRSRPFEAEPHDLAFDAAWHLGHHFLDAPTHPLRIRGRHLHGREGDHRSSGNRMEGHMARGEVYG